MKHLKFLDNEHTMISMIDENDNLVFAVKDRPDGLYERAINGEFGEILSYTKVQEQQKQNEDIIVEKINLKLVLLKYKILKDFEYIISQMDDITQILWNDSIRINKKSVLIDLLKKSVKLPDNSDITDDVIEQIFIEAEQIQLI